MSASQAVTESALLDAVFPGLGIGIHADVKSPPCFLLDVLEGPLVTGVEVR